MSGHVHGFICREDDHGDTPTPIYDSAAWDAGFAPLPDDTDEATA